MNENQLGSTDPDRITRLEDVIGDDPLRSNHRAVAAVEVANDPLPARMENFHVVSAATIVFQDNLVGGRATDRRRLSGDEPEDVAPFSSFADDEISEFRHGLSARVTLLRPLYTLSSGGWFLQDAPEAKSRNIGGIYSPSGLIIRATEFRSIERKTTKFACFCRSTRLG